MKIVVKIYLFILLITISAGCTFLKSTRMKHQLRGHWALENVVYDDIKPDMQEAVNKNVQAMLPGSYIQFSKGQVFTYFLSEYYGDGKWKFSPDLKEMCFDSIFLAPAVCMELKNLEKKHFTIRYKSGENYMNLVFVRR